MPRKNVADDVEIAAGARKNFIAGYSLGPFLQFGIPHCFALGLIVFGSRGESQATADLKAIYGNIQNSLNDLQKKMKCNFMQANDEIFRPQFFLLRFPDAGLSG